jgi:hypothetical protein
MHTHAPAMSKMKDERWLIQRLPGVSEQAILREINAAGHTTHI